MTFYVALTVALAATFTAGWFLHAWWTRNRQAKARGGMLPTPLQVVDRWNFPKAPMLYDQAADDEGLTPLPTEFRASLGNPLIPDLPLETRMADAAINETVRALDRDDNYSRKAPIETEPLYLPGESSEDTYRRLKPGKAS